MTTINWSSPTPLVVKGTTNHIESANSPAVAGLDQNLLIAYVSNNDSKLYSTQYNVLDGTCSAPTAVPHQAEPVNSPLAVALRGVYTERSGRIALAYTASSNLHPNLQFFDMQNESWGSPIDLALLHPNPAHEFSFSPAISVLGEHLHVIAPGITPAPREVFDCRYDLFQNEMASPVTTNISQQVFRGYACETLDNSKVVMVLAGIDSDDGGGAYYYAVFDSYNQSWSTPKALPGNAYASWQTPSLRSIGGGKAVMLFAHNSSTIAYGIYDSGTDTWSNAELLSFTSSGGGPALAVSGTKLYGFFPMDNSHSYNVITAPIPS